ncbi:septal ring lytic transglycosylase RlpA family protein [Capnocytophaga gingivalis]|uniref:septal ring lytic transglycosylase RlpA family protein n=1 Tax=Capnocytophaga gingivalis TaxID=1017 RepID=UPI0028E8BA8C|nr:septal ring lytic transglycosylase RlpA family protein [Capnocytophaga gingivalis]
MKLSSILKLCCFFLLLSCHSSKMAQQRKATHKSSKTVAKKKKTTSEKDKSVAETSSTVSTMATSGVASYYHNKFNGRKTASGEVFSNNKLIAAHRTYPFGTYLKVTNVANGKSVVVKVNDRGPFTKGKELDLSRKAFMDITDNPNKGNLQVNIEVVTP